MAKDVEAFQPERWLKVKILDIEMISTRLAKRRQMLKKEPLAEMGELIPTLAQKIDLDICLLGSDCQVDVAYTDSLSWSIFGLCMEFDLILFSIQHLLPGDPSPSLVPDATVMKQALPG